MTVPYGRIDQIRHVIRSYSKMVADDARYGNAPSHLADKGHDFADLREYTYGDDARDIDWKSSTRTGKILVQRRVVEKERRVLVVCTNGSFMEADTSIGEDKSDVMIQIAGSVAYLAHSCGDRYAFMFVDGDELSCSEFRNGMEFLERNLAALERSVATKSKYAPQDIVEHLSLSGRKKQVIVIVTDVTGAFAMSEKALKRIAGENDLRMIVIEDAYLFEKGSVDMEIGDVLPRISEKKRKNLLAAEVSERTRSWDALKTFAKRCGIPLASVKASSEIPEMMMDLFGERGRK